jgi:4-amino-4-deoxy-L-arabinose transferase-like glycosyltransferase
MHPRWYSPNRYRLRGRDFEIAGLALAAWVVLVIVIHIFWLRHFRASAVPEYDEAGYIALALNDVHGLRDGGLRGLASAYLTGAPSAPLVPLVTVVAYLLLGDGVGISVATQLASLVLLAGATYGLGRRLMPARFAALAAGVVVVLPVTTDYARIFHFAVPATALLTGAAWALSSSDGLRNVRRAALAGFFLGGMVLSRTMTIAYLPGIGLVAVLVALVPAHDRMKRVRSLGVLGATAALVTATWLLPRANYRAVRHYLVGTGYGERATEYGSGYSPLSADYWLKEARVVVGELQLPIAMSLLACLVAYLATRKWNRTESRGWARSLVASPAIVPLAVVVEGYAVLTTSRNVGTAFSLPWIPSLVVLCTGCASRVSRDWMRAGLVGALCLSALFAVTVKSDAIPALSGSHSFRLPLLGSQPIFDGGWLARENVVDAGYVLPTPDHSLPTLHAQWLPFAEGEMSAVLDFARAQHLEARLTVATGDVILSTTRFGLAAELARHTRVPTERLLPAADVTAYESVLEAGHATILVTADPAPAGSELNIADVASAASAAGYTSFRTRIAPDGRRVTWWWRPPTS